MYNITGGTDLTLQEVNRVSQVVTSLADPSCNIIFGAVVDAAYDGIINVTIIATGFSQSYEDQLFGRNGGAATATRKGGESTAQVRAVCGLRFGACACVCVCPCACSCVPVCDS